MVEYFTAHLWQFWIIVCIACLILELLLSTGDFYIICFAVGAATSMLAATIGFSFTVQVIIFAAVAVVSLFFLRPAAIRFLHRDEVEHLSNADALMGRIGTVSQDIEENGFGRVAIDGDDWKAVSASKLKIEKGTKVEVVGRDSIILTVRKAS